MGRNDWTREQHLLALDLYLQIPFGTIHRSNPKIIDRAVLIGRNANAVSYKLANFARLDPELQQRGIKGASHGAKGEERVWNEFNADREAVVLEINQLLADRLGTSIEEAAHIETDDLPTGPTEREAIVRVRIKQDHFRRRVLSLYEFKCCITGLNYAPLLVASHIAPWAQDKNNRLNPRNGLCLNALHDRAFDQRLMWIDQENLIRFSGKLKSDVRSGEFATWLTAYEGKPLILPKRFTPDPAFLSAHAQRCRRG